MHRTAVLFVPVSGATGAGEYYRCLAIAQRLVAEQPDIQVHFALASNAAVEKQAGFAYHELTGSPTHDSAGVIMLLKRFRPTVVVFDSTFRTRQLKAARQSGALVACLISRRRKRRRLFAPWKLPHIDRIWISGEIDERYRTLGPLERVTTARWYGQVRFVGPILPPAADATGSDQLPQLPARYILVAPGGGGGTLAGRPTTDAFQEAARLLVEQQGIPVLFVAGPLYHGNLIQTDGLHACRSLPPSDLMAAMQDATVCLLGGGSLLLQGIAAGRACVGANAGGKDQPERIRCLAAQGLIIEPAEPSPHGMAIAAGLLWDDADKRATIEDNAKRSAIADGYRTIGADLLRTINETQRNASTACQP